MSAACLSSLDALITAQSLKLESLRARKKGLTQQLTSNAQESISLSPLRGWGQEDLSPLAPLRGEGSGVRGNEGGPRPD